MKERLLQLLDLEQLSPSKFADIIGVQRSSVSHVISGRNKPSYDFLQKTLKAFPGLNASWLMMGEGSMYEQMGRSTSGNLFDPINTAPTEPNPDDIQDNDREVEQPEAAETTKSVPTDGQDKTETTTEETFAASVVSVSKKKIVQVMVIYEDDTFRAFTPAH
jgi:transcriptional regulator with XRE-family HTH domain